MGIFIQQQSLYQAWGFFFSHASDVCMTSVSVVEKLGIALLTFLHEHLSVGVPVPCFPCCHVLWGAVMWLVQAEECSCLQVSGVPHSAEAPPCPIPHPPTPSLPGMDVRLDCPCVLPDSTTPPKLPLSPTCTLFMLGPKSEDILISYIFIFQVMAGNKCVASPIWYPFQSIYYFLLRFSHSFHCKNINVATFYESTCTICRFWSSYLPQRSRIRHLLWRLGWLQFLLHGSLCMEMQQQVTQ